MTENILVPLDLLLAMAAFIGKNHAWESVDPMLSEVKAIVEKHKAAKQAPPHDRILPKDKKSEDLKQK